MLYTFKSKNTADLIMLVPHARQLLQIIGQDTGPQGIILAEHIPAALQALQEAVAREAGAPVVQDTAENPLPEPQEQVTLRQRTQPFIDMLRRNHSAGHDVLWGT
jgi:cyclopropane-fatty-acyl-phospholipid synthase